ncbi:MAG: glycoside hydrolase family 97 N-terminal domain-containing protein, partial [Bacteroidales bacterium]|nr:glycoside hydrolase family 97 N-terminal domain-containing protein [Bacteroidales bacterium]
MRKTVSLLILSLFVVCGLSAKEYKVTSPDGRIVLTIDAGSDIKWSVAYDGKELIRSVKVGMELSGGKVLGSGESVRRASPGTVNGIIRPVVNHKRSVIEDKCNTLIISFRSGFSLNFRAYNDGVAYRFETSMKNDIIIKNEISGIEFPSGSASYYPLEESFMSHNERKFIYSDLDTITDKHLASLPSLFQIGGINVLITEADIRDYPGMWLRGGGSGKLTGVWPQYPDSERLKGDRNLFVTATREYIAMTSGTRTFPWRAFVITADDGKLIESDLVYKLAEPNRL